MLEQGQRHHQRHDALVILADDCLHFLFVIRADGLLEVAADVLQHIGVGAAGGALFQAGHQVAEIAGGHLVEVDVPGHAAEAVAQALVVHQAVGHQQILVARVKRQQAVAGQALGQQLLPTGVDEDAGQEVFPQYRVIQAAIFFHRQVRVARAERLGVNATPSALHRRSVFTVDLDAFQAAGRRLLHEDVAAQVGVFGGHFAAVCVQRRSDIQLAVYGTDGLGLFGIAHQANGFTGDTQADRHFRAQRHEVEVLGEDLAA